VLVQVSPVCRHVGTFRVRGHRGVNRIRLGDRVGRHLLGPGTYRIVARSHPASQEVTRLVVVKNASGREIRAARSANACPRGAMLALAAGSSGSPFLAAPKVRHSPTVGAKKTSEPRRDSGILGAKFAKRTVDAARAVPLWLYGLVLLSIVLLAAGAFLPKAAPRGLAASIVFGLTGAVVLLVATIAYTLF